MPRTTTTKVRNFLLVARYTSFSCEIIWDLDAIGLHLEPQNSYYSTNTSVALFEEKIDLHPRINIITTYVLPAEILNSSSKRGCLILSPQRLFSLDVILPLSIHAQHWMGQKNTVNSISQLFILAASMQKTQSKKERMEKFPLPSVMGRY